MSSQEKEKGKRRSCRLQNILPKPYNENEEGDNEASNDEEEYIPSSSGRLSSYAQRLSRKRELGGEAMVEMFKESERVRMRLARLKWTPAQKEAHREKAKQRQAAYRERQKELRTKLLKTRKTQMKLKQMDDKKREYNRKKQRECRQRRKEREQKLKEDLKKDTDKESDNDTEILDTDESSTEEKSGTYNDSKNSQSVTLPEQPKEWASKFMDLYTEASPRKRQHLKEMGFESPTTIKKLKHCETVVQNMATTAKKLCKSRSSTAIANRRYIAGLATAPFMTPKSKDKEEDQKACGSKLQVTPDSDTSEEFMFGSDNERSDMSGVEFLDTVFKSQEEQEIDYVEFINDADKIDFLIDAKQTGHVEVIQTTGDGREVEPEAADSECVGEVEPQAAGSEIVGEVEPQAADTDFGGKVEPQMPDTGKAAEIEPEVRVNSGLKDKIAQRRLQWRTRQQRHRENKEKGRTVPQKNTLYQESKGKKMSDVRGTSNSSDPQPDTAHPSDKEALKYICSTFNFKSQFVKSLKTPPGKPGPKGIQKEQLNDVKEFYQDEENATILPGAKNVYKKLKAPKIVLKTSMKSLHRKYNPKRSIGYSTFVKLRPKNVVPYRQASWEQCLCEDCENVKRKLEALSYRGIPGVPKTVFHISDITLCPYQGQYPHMLCLLRKCSDCGLQNLEKFLGQLMSGLNFKHVTYKEWSSVTVGTGSDGKPKKRTILVSKTTTTDKLITILTQSLKDLSLHLFICKWQHEMYKSKRENPGDGEIVAGTDFAENFRCENQREVSHAHWGYKNLTVHPMVCHYRCPVCDQVIKHSIIAVSDDLNHDAAAVQAFLMKAIEIIQAYGFNINSLLQCSDNCAYQYKCKKAFFDMTLIMKKLGIRYEKLYSGKGHGKSLMDGEGAVVKRHVIDMIKAQVITVNSAQEFVAACSNIVVDETKTIHELHMAGVLIRHIVEINDIPRPQDKEELLTVKGTRSYHCIRGRDNGKIQARMLSCFCPEKCQDDQNSTDPGAQCRNHSHVTDFQEHNLVKVNKRQGTKRLTKATAVKCSEPESEEGLHPEKDKCTKKREKSVKANAVKANETKSAEGIQTVLGKGPNKRRKSVKSDAVKGNEPESEEGIQTGQGKGPNKRRKAVKANAVKGNGPESREGFDTDKEKGSNETKRQEKDDATDSAREEFFIQAQKILATVTSFEEFLFHSSKIQSHCTYDVPIVNDNNCKLAPIDLKSCDLLPSDSPPGYLPRITGATGDCLFNGGSMLVWGTENGHRELRVRTCME